MRITNPGGLQTVSVDGVTITGNGTPASPLVGASSTPAGWPLTFWATPPPNGIGVTPVGGSPNTVTLLGFSLPAQVQFNKLYLHMTQNDATNLYDVGIYSAAGALLCHSGAVHITSPPDFGFTMLSGPITLNPGKYFLGTTGNSTQALCNLAETGPGNWSFNTSASGGASSSGVLPSSVTPAATLPQGVQAPIFALSI